MKTPFSIKSMALGALVFAMASCTSSTTPPTVTHMPGDHWIDASGDVQMVPPDSADGFQIAIAPFTVPADSEVQFNHYFKLPVNKDVEISRLEIVMNEGTHHMNFFKSDYDVPDTVYQDFNSTAIFNSSAMMIESQVQSLDWSLPAGTAVALKARQQMILQTHYVNSAAGNQFTPNGRGKILINCWYSKVPVTTKASMCFATNHNIVIPPHSDTSFTKDMLFNAVRASGTDKIQILSLTGHFHSRGKDFIIMKYNQTTMVADTIYRSGDWNEPPFKAFPTPIELDLKGNDVLRYTCHYVNNTANTYTFGSYVATQEHANVFCWFTPAFNNGATVYDPF